MSYGGYGGYNSNNYNGGSRGYNPDPFADPGGSRDASAGHEMASFPQPSPKPILQQCSDIEREIDVIERSIMALASARKRYLDDPDTSGNSQSKRDVDVRRQQIMDQYRGLADRVRAMQSDPESQRWSARVKVAGDKLKNAIQKFQEQEAAFRMAEDKRMERQLRIVRPDVSDDEIREAVASGEGAIFQQAVMTNSRLAQAGGVLNAVKERHKEMQKIEQSLVELLQLLNDMQELLAKQEVTIMEIDTQAEQAAEHMEEANVQLDKAIVSAKKTRKWKWICLGICVAIVVIIVVAVVAYIMINRAANGGGGGGNNNNNNNNNNSGSTNPKGNNGNNNNNSGSGTTGQKRNLFGRNVLDDLQMNTARAVAFTSEQPAARGYPVDTSSTEANAAAPAARSSRRRLNRVRGAAAAEKRFVVSWDPTDPTGP